MTIGYVKIAIEHDHLWWIDPLKMVISLVEFFRLLYLVAFSLRVFPSDSSHQQIAASDYRNLNLYWPHIFLLLKALSACWHHPPFVARPVSLFLCFAWFHNLRKSEVRQLGISIRTSARERIDGKRSSHFLKSSGP